MTTNTIVDDHPFSAPTITSRRRNWADSRHTYLGRISQLTTYLTGVIIVMTQLNQATLAAPNAATDPRIDPQIRSFLAELNKDSSPFWELPQPRPQEILTELQNKTRNDIYGVTPVEKTITQDGRSVKLYIMKPQNVKGTPGVLLFIHGGVWIVGNFQNHQRLLRDLVVGSGQIGVFVEYTPLPDGKFPTPLEESYSA